MTAVADYWGPHRPAGPEYGAPLSDVEPFMPDYYTRPSLYRHDPSVDGPSERAIIGARGNPGALVWVYRAVPPGIRGAIRRGDWVTTSRAYAQRHAEDGWGVASLRVRAGDLWTSGDSINEWGYWP